jgi:TetR/AcrR family transcriptional repressor of nem operon
VKKRNISANIHLPYIENSNHALKTETLIWLIQKKLIISKQRNLSSNGYFRLTLETTGRIVATMALRSRKSSSRAENRVEETKTRLLEAGVAMFGRCGYSGVGLKELLQQVNVPKGSFYNYFDSKEDFARHTIDYYGASFVALVQQVLSSRDGTALDRFDYLFGVLIRVFEEKHFTEGCLMGDLSTELGDVSEVCRKSLEKIVEQFALSFEDLVKQGQQDGSIRTDMDSKDLALFSLDAWEGALIRMRVKKNKDPLEQSRRLILQYLGG